MRSLLVLALFGACSLPTKTVRSTMRRGPVWAQPGTDLVFAWSYREENLEQKSYEKDTDPYNDEHHHRWVTSNYTVVGGVRPAVVKPDGTVSYLTAVDTEVEPYYWNGKILWVLDKQGRLFGMGPDGTTKVGRGTFTQVRMPLPFVVDRRAGRIVDLSTGQTIDLPPHEVEAMVTTHGRLMRLTRVEPVVGALRVTQAVIDWTGATPVRLPDIAFETPALPVASSSPGTMPVREALTILPDGQRFAEVVTTSAGTQLYVHDLAAAKLVANIAVPPSKAHANAHGTASLFALGGDKLAFVVQGEHVEGTGHVCYRGVTLSLASGVANPIPGGACVSAFEGRHGRYWLQTNKGAAYVDNTGKLLQLGTNLREPLVLGPSTIAYTIAADGGGLDVEAFDLATATRTTLGHHADLRDKLINVLPGRVIFSAGTRIITEPAHGPSTTLELPPIGN